jgi:hypothetical protein
MAEYDESTRVTILDKLAEGMSLSAICREDGMPNRLTVQRWQEADEAFDVAVTHAREEGYQARADAAVIAACSASDAGLGRLAFDAERWYLGKLSNAFSDNKEQRVRQTVTLSEEAASWLGHKS